MSASTTARGLRFRSCHAYQPKQVTPVSQNEHSIWAGQDKHARAYQVLPMMFPPAWRAY
jgi:hypothetical protein